MRTLIVDPLGVADVKDTSQKYLLRVGHELLGDELYLQYNCIANDLYIVYDDDAMLKGRPMGPLGFYGTIMIAKVTDSDENDLIISDMDDDTIKGLLRICSA